MSERQKQNRQYWVILTIVFLGFLGISIPYLIFPALFLNPSYSILPENWGESSRAIFLGITLAAYPLGQFIGSPILGSLSDDYGRRGLLSGSLILAGIFNLFTGLAIEWHMLGLLVLSRFVSGIMEGNIAIARAMAADLTTISKHDTFGKINAAASIAFLLGPLIGGVMTDKEIFENFTTSTPFYAICILFFAISILNYLIIQNKPITPTQEHRSFWERINLIKRLSVLFTNKRLRFLIMISTCFTLAVDIFYEFGPVYLTVKWNLDPSDLIYYNGVLCLALAIGNGMLPTFFSERFSNPITIICSIGLFSLFLMGIVITNSGALMLTLFGLCGLVIGLAVTLITVKISNSVQDSIQGEVMGTQLSLRVLGDATICLFGGILLLISPKAILIIASGMSLLAMSYYAVKTFKARFV